MSQRGGTVSYHVFTAGTSLLAFALFYLASEIGTPVSAPAPAAGAGAAAAWWQPWRLAESVLGLHLLPLPSAPAAGGGAAQATSSPPRKALPPPASPSGGGAVELADVPAGFAPLRSSRDVSQPVSLPAPPHSRSEYGYSPEAPPAAVAAAAPAAGEQRLLVGRWYLLEVLGENSLAVYVMADAMSDKLGECTCNDGRGEQPRALTPPPARPPSNCCSAGRRHDAEQHPAVVLRAVRARLPRPPHVLHAIPQGAQTLPATLRLLLRLLRRSSGLHSCPLCPYNR